MIKEYRAIRTPTLLLAGEDDRVTAPRVQKKIAGILPNSRFEVIADSGHVVYLGAGGDFMAAFGEWLALGGPGRAG